MNLLFSLLLLILLPMLITHSASKCPDLFQCGNLGQLSFPFTEPNTPNCGLFTVHACNSTSNPTLELNGFSYDILQKLSPNKLFVSDPRLADALGRNRCSTFTNLSPSQAPYISFSVTPTLITLFTCNNQSYSQSVHDYFRNYNHTSCPFFTVYYRHPFTGDSVRNIPPECSTMKLPAKTNSNSSELFDLLTYTFTIEWNVSEACYECHERGGMCMSTNDEFYCTKGNRKKVSKRIFLIGGLSLAAVTTTLVISFILFKKKHTLLLELLGFHTSRTDYEKNIEIFLQNDDNHLQQSRYTYSDLKKITNSFSHSLGRGGYGSVYKGKLRDGRFVAVKMLNESSGNGEEFINEVATISKTSHVNIVALLGFCFEGARRALVYEFMPNGSLEKFVNNPTRSRSSASGGVVYPNNNFKQFLPESRLGWQKLFEIVIGIGEGLDYLHRGCSTRIFHFDIKPHNILLDKDLNPKISDFGLAKLCPNRSSIVSMSVAKGTIGYIAPELIYRSLGEASHKSDVYSYGMMVLEMVMGKQNVDPFADDEKSEIYFPNPIYKLLERNDSVGNILLNEDEDEDEDENESKLAKKMIIVGLWCVQIEPGNRPSIERVVEMLHGSVELLEVPPKHAFFSALRPAPGHAFFYES